MSSKRKRRLGPAWRNAPKPEQEIDNATRFRRDYLDGDSFYFGRRFDAQGLELRGAILKEKGYAERPNGIYTRGNPRAEGYMHDVFISSLDPRRDSFESVGHARYNNFMGNVESLEKRGATTVGGIILGGVIGGAVGACSYFTDLDGLVDILITAATAIVGMVAGRAGVNNNLRFTEEQVNAFITNHYYGRYLGRSAYRQLLDS